MCCAFSVDNKTKLSLVIGDYRKVDGEWPKIGDPVAVPSNFSDCPAPSPPSSDLSSSSNGGDNHQVVVSDSGGENLLPEIEAEKPKEG